LFHLLKNISSNIKNFYKIPMKKLTEIVIFKNNHKNFIDNFGLYTKIFI